MIGRGLAGHLCEIIVAQGELAGVGEVTGNVRFLVLQLDGAFGAIEPGSVVVRLVVRRWIRGGRQSGAIGAWKCAEVIVKGVVFFDDDHYVFDWIIWLHDLDVPLNTFLTTISCDFNWL